MFDETRVSCIESSTKAGKTVSGIAWLSEQAFLHGKMGREFWWVAPIFPQSKIAYRRTKAALPKNVYRANESELSITLVNGARMVFKSGERPDCFDDKTEILTDSGWKLFSDLDKTEKVLTLSPETLTAEWQAPDRYIDDPYTGPMYAITSRPLDLVVTPRHRFLIQRPGKRRLRKFKTIEQIASRRYPKDMIPASVGWTGTDDPALTHDRCAFMGIFLAEGCIAGSKGGTTALAGGNYDVIIAQKEGERGGEKGDVRAQIMDLFARLGYSPKTTKGTVYVRNKLLWSGLREVGNVYSKRIPRQYKELPPDKLRVLIHWMVLGDGSVRRGGRMVYYTASKGLADDLQEVCVKAGLSATLHRREVDRRMRVMSNGKSIRGTVDTWQVSIYVGWDFNLFTSSSRSYIEKTDYSGRVYCVSVPNGTVLVRRNGKICWTGNSLYGEDVYAVVLDEASRMREEVWHAIRSTLTYTQGPVRMIGNVHGRKNWFYQLCRQAESGTDGMAFHRITAWDAVRAGILDREEIESAERDFKRLGREGVFKQLYMAEAADDGDNPFGLEAIRACCETMTRFSTEYPKAAGVDLAGRGAQNIAPRATIVDRDYTAIMMLDTNGCCTYLHRFQKNHTDTAASIAASVAGTPALIDSTGSGDPVVEGLQRRGDMQVLGFTYTERTRQELLEHLALYIGEGMIQWPGNLKMGAALRAELESFEFHYSRRGVRWSVSEGQHDDLAMAAALVARRMPWRRRVGILPQAIMSPGGSRWTGMGGESAAWQSYLDSMKPTTVGINESVEQDMVPVPLIGGDGRSSPWR